MKNIWKRFTESDFFCFLIFPFACIYILIGAIVVIIYDGIKQLFKGVTDVTDKGKNLTNIGILILSIPAILMIGIFAIYGIVWIFVAFSTILGMGDSIFTFFGVIIPVVGGLFMIAGLFQK